MALPVLGALGAGGQLAPAMPSYPGSEGWTHSTPWYFQDIVLILIANLGKRCRARWRGRGVY